MTSYYDMNGDEVDEATGMALFSATPPIAHDVLVSDGGSVDVSTIFLSADHRHGGDGPPLIFETMQFWDGDEVGCQRWSSLGEARQGHAEIVGRLRGGR